MISLGVVLALLAATAEVLIAAGPLTSIYVAYLFPAVGALYVVTGLLAWWRRPANRLGLLMTACGTAIIVSSGANSALPALVVVGAITATLPLSVLIHLVHASPGGVVRGAAARTTVIAAYVAGLVLQAPIWMFTPQPPGYDALVVSPRPDLAHDGTVVQQSFGAFVLVATVYLLGRRLRDLSAGDRRLLATLLGFALLAVVAVVVGGDVLPSFDLGPETVADVQLAAVALVPVGFSFVVLRGGFTPPAEMAVFADEVAAATGSPGAARRLERAVAAALGDRSATLLRWFDGGYVDVDGRRVDAVGSPTPYRAVARIDGADGPLGAVMYDTALDTDPARLAAVTHVAGIALEREHLADAVIASRAELQEASQRVLAAGDAERRRVARDLHDGLQGSLVLLGMQARDLAAAASDEDGMKAAIRLADGLDGAAAALRDFVSGVLPSPLVERGLAAAVQDLADTVPLQVTVSVRPPDLTLPTQLETTAYFVVAEAVTNVLKHAGARRVDISVVLDAGVLSVDVVDDGVGNHVYTGGTGLAGLRDRLAILGGSVEVDRVDVGTRVSARLPCG